MTLSESDQALFAGITAGFDKTAEHPTGDVIPDDNPLEAAQPTRWWEHAGKWLHRRRLLGWLGWLLLHMMPAGYYWIAPAKSRAGYFCTRVANAMVAGFWQLVVIATLLMTPIAVAGLIIVVVFNIPSEGGAPPPENTTALAYR